MLASRNACITNVQVPSKKGINSFLVRSVPSASAMVVRRWMAFSRSKTSSCCMRESASMPEMIATTCSYTFSSSISTAMGYNSSFSFGPSIAPSYAYELYSNVRCRSMKRIVPGCLNNKKKVLSLMNQIVKLDFASKRSSPRDIEADI